MVSCLATEDMKSFDNKGLRWMGILLATLLIGSCESKESTDLLIRHGTSFGECMGYCRREIVVEKASFQLRVTGWDSIAYPTRQLNGPLTPAVWDSLETLADLEALRQFQDVIGCPDCADGGAEWLTIQEGTASKQVTFEHGETLEGFEELIDLLRRLQAQAETEIIDR